MLMINTSFEIDPRLADILAFDIFQGEEENSTVSFNLKRAGKMGLPNVRDYLNDDLALHKTSSWRFFYRDRGPGAKFEDFVVRADSPGDSEFYLIFIDGLLLKITKKTKHNTILFILLKTRIKPGTTMTVLSNKGIIPHQTGTISYTFTEADFDAEKPERSSAPTDLVRAISNNLFVDKKGFIKELFFDVDTNCRATVALYDKLRRFFEAELSYVLYATHGSALGLTRNKRIIENDDDFDCGYVSSYRTCEAVSIERFGIIDALRRAGFNCSFSATGHIIVREGKYVVDIGPSWFDAEGDFNASSFSSFPGTREEFLPFKPVQYLKRTVLLLNNVEKWLALNYGDGWSVPDPFYRTDAPVKALEQRKVFVADTEYFTKIPPRVRNVEADAGSPVDRDLARTAGGS